MKKFITPEQREELRQLLAECRALNSAMERARMLAEDITGDTEQNSQTHDACYNNQIGVDDLLTRLKVSVRRSAAAPRRPIPAVAAGAPITAD